VFIASITGVEIIAALSRRSRIGSITPTDAMLLCNQFRDDYRTEYQVIEITDQIIESGMKLAEKYKLRGYDAVQLAAGCAIDTLCSANSLSLTFVSADNELNTAALEEGLVVMNPRDL
jgi:predicted nucleic acid-binding protein